MAGAIRREFDCVPNPTLPGRTPVGEKVASRLVMRDEAFKFIRRQAGRQIFLRRICHELRTKIVVLGCTFGGCWHFWLTPDLWWRRRSRKFVFRPLLLLSLFSLG